MVKPTVSGAVNSATGYNALPLPNLLLPWYGGEEEDSKYLKILRNFLIAFLVLTLITALYPVPEKLEKKKKPYRPSWPSRVEKKSCPSHHHHRQNLNQNPSQNRNLKSLNQSQAKKAGAKTKARAQKPKPKPKPDPKPVKPKVTEQQKLEKARE